MHSGSIIIDYISTIDCNIQVLRIVENKSTGDQNKKYKYCSTDMASQACETLTMLKEWPAYFVQNLHLIFWGKYVSLHW
ncbi:hypothetical protein HanRHA438_Chr16g0787821 [Helianthus annuus]|nr:hypothetical protein HanIR_Chr16g0843741 [Helianthus annuus]KAJ0838326.1 hypothetical protein HanRHA438_Chr16g0787821 [Helianthus annuus]